MGLPLRRNKVRKMTKKLHPRIWEAGARNNKENLTEKYALSIRII
jgi:hypothetical protein